ncbi:uncharacterized protein LOC119525979 [Choloepus didactylus]|uniref:uncharacterized protein LOC119525979 n=1 Tax=Choloepus didactylus TaxID=27675 RepID=UPI00189FE98F|nr:uncharacterized protein LOC119525979 [Choloepus didactylus]
MGAWLPGGRGFLAGRGAARPCRSAAAVLRADRSAGAAIVLCPVIGKLLVKRVVLASASPRRQEILIQAGLQFEVVPSRFKETLDNASFPTPYAYAIETAKQKALEVAHRMHLKDLQTPDIVIGANTIVVSMSLFPHPACQGTWVSSYLGGVFEPEVRPLELSPVPRLSVCQPEAQAPHAKLPAAPSCSPLPQRWTQVHSWET